MTAATAIRTDFAWLDAGALEDIPVRGSRKLCTAAGPVAVFRTGDDQVFALHDRCPHKQGPLSDGIVSGHAVACPLHNWLIDLKSGQPLGADAGKGGVPVAAVRVEAGRVFVSV